jgi:hypothetical protein
MFRLLRMGRAVERKKRFPSAMEDLRKIIVVDKEKSDYHMS